MAKAARARLQFDPEAAVAHLRGADARLARVIDRAGPFALNHDPAASTFEALARAIVYQQLSGKAAATIYGRVRALFPGRAGFRAQALVEIEEASLRGAGCSRSKALSLKDLAAKALDGQVPTFKELDRMSDDDIKSHLVQIRGIGPWTVEMLLLFTLGRPDVLPVSDLGVRKGFQLTFKKRELPEASTLIRHAERWRPYRSVASWYLWRAVDLDRSGK